VMTGQQTPKEAAAAYDDAVTGIVGEEETVDLG
jgi:multiple sugar transport system substrate-binding protein